MQIKTREVIPNVLTLTFDTNSEMALAFIRIQEFYESPKYKGKFFTLEEFMNYWAESFGNGIFDYTTRWSGFNVPGKILSEWMELFGYNENPDNVRDMEKELVEKVLSRYNKDEIENTYIIGVAKDCKKRQEVIDHEVAHAMYTMYPKYKKACLKLLHKLKRERLGKVVYSGMHNKLIKMGYCEDVIEDEMQAYWSVPDSPELHEAFKTLRKIEKNYKTHKGKIKGNQKK